MKKILPYLTALGILIVLFMIAFFGTDLIMKLVVGHRNEVVTPDLINTDFDVARKQCSKMKLFLKEIDKIHHEEVEKGRIISQKPNPGIMTKKNRTIEVVVSEGPNLVRVPFIENLTVLQAKLKLHNAGLQIGEKNYRYSNEVKKNKVIFSEPNADELIPKKSKINLIISLGEFTSSNDNKWKDLLDN